MAGQVDYEEVNGLLADCFGVDNDDGLGIFAGDTLSAYSERPQALGPVRRWGKEMTPAIGQVWNMKPTGTPGDKPVKGKIVGLKDASQTPPTDVTSLTDEFGRVVVTDYLVSLDTEVEGGGHSPLTVRGGTFLAGWIPPTP